MKYFILTFLFLFFFYQNVCSQNTTLKDTTYIVQKGESLYAIARKLNVFVNDLYKWNNLAQESVIYPGQQLTVYCEQNVAVPTEKTDKSQTTYTHTVQKNETLYSISKQWNVSISDLRQWNDLTDNNIHAGQQLTVHIINNSISLEPSIDNDDEPAVKPLITFLTKQRILLFGDSMIESLNKRMRQYAAENDHDVLNVIWYSSSTKWWAQHIDTLEYFINTFRPTYIIICLGANELFIKNTQSRDTYVKQILKKVEHLPYVWVGPPNWKDDTGINDLIRKNVGEERFFPSKNYKFNRTKDGAHLTRTAATNWMDLIAQWLNNDVPEPLFMNFPNDETKMRGKNILLMPLHSKGNDL
jgi:LysM repeat protein/lysophospholipase L1-like esterase